MAFLDWIHLSRYMPYVVVPNDHLFVSDGCNAPSDRVSLIKLSPYPLSSFLVSTGSLPRQVILFFFYYISFLRSHSIAHALCSNLAIFAILATRNEIFCLSHLAHRCRISQQPSLVKFSLACPSLPGYH